MAVTTVSCLNWAIGLTRVVGDKIAPEPVSWSEASIGSAEGRGCVLGVTGRGEVWTPGDGVGCLGASCGVEQAPCLMPYLVVCACGGWAR